MVVDGVGEEDDKARKPAGRDHGCALAGQNSLNTLDHALHQAEIARNNA